MDEMRITGKFIVTVFHHETTLFTVAKFRLYELEERDITVTGYLPTLSKELLFRLFGSYQEHPRYGMQFAVQRFEQILPTDADSVVTFLSGPLFPGIGKKLAEKIVETLGNDALTKIRENPNLLQIVKGMNARKQLILIEGLSQNIDLESSLRFFTTHGFGMRNIMKMDQVYGNKVLEIVKENPYQLVEDIDGIGFQTADKLALSIGFDVKSVYRSKAALYALVLELSMASGDSYVPYAVLQSALHKKIGHDIFQLDQLIDILVESKQLMREQNRVYHYSQYIAEIDIAQFFYHFLKNDTADFEESLINPLIEELEMKENITYDVLQKSAISTFLKHPFFILTGGPGTGKSTIVKAMVGIYRRLFPHRIISLCAPTGRAGKRLSELADVEATTIHRLLKWNLETNTFGMNEDTPLVCDLLIIDEMSMVDAYVMHQLLLACKNVQKIVFIGDEDQLPSVSCGCILRDFIASKQFEVIRLEKIFRQQEGSDVVSLAYDMKHQASIDFKQMHEVKFFECSLYDVKDLVLRVVEMAFEKGYSLSEVQVLAPKYSGVAGIDMLNRMLQKLCNPPNQEKKELQIGYRLFREGDKILQLKNQPDEDVYNGDIGILAEIILANEDVDHKNRMYVNFEGSLVEYTADTFINITHAYCISIHKSQGSEYPIVIMPIVQEYYFMLSKRLLYTGITRAKKSLMLIGEKRAWEKGMLTLEHKERQTTLQERLAANFKKRE